MVKVYLGEFLDFINLWGLVDVYVVSHIVGVASLNYHLLTLSKVNYLMASGVVPHNLYVSFKVN